TIELAHKDLGLAIELARPCDRTCKEPRRAGRHRRTGARELLPRPTERARPPGLDGDLRDGARSSAPLRAGMHAVDPRLQVCRSSAEGPRGQAARRSAHSWALDCIASSFSLRKAAAASMGSIMPVKRSSWPLASFRT